MLLRRLLALCSPLVVFAPSFAQETDSGSYAVSASPPAAATQEAPPPAPGGEAPLSGGEHPDLPAPPEQPESLPLDEPVETFSAGEHAESRQIESLEADAPGEGVMGNQDVLDMMAAQLSDSTIIAAIGANESGFDVSPRALVALKRAGVSDLVMEAMLAVESAEKRDAPARGTGAAPAPEQIAAAAEAAAAPAAAAQMSPETLAALSQVIERLAAQTAAQEAAKAPEEADAAVAARRVLASEHDVERTSSTEGRASAREAAPLAARVPRAWIVAEGDRLPLVPTIAQVALTDVKRSNGAALKTLQGMAGQALAFANPAFGFAATGLGGLFRGDDSATAVWALSDLTAAREFPSTTVFEIEFGTIPGLNPDEYRPAIVQLVPTMDNYRLVGAAKTSGDNPTPTGPIIEELVTAKLTQLGRGNYRVAFGEAVPAGEYALVLRPVLKSERGRRRDRDTESSLGEIMGGGASQVLYMTWDFSVRR